MQYISFLKLNFRIDQSTLCIEGKQFHKMNSRQVQKRIKEKKRGKNIKDLDKYGIKHGIQNLTLENIFLQMLPTIF